LRIILEIFQSVVDQTFPIVIAALKEESRNVPCTRNSKTNSDPNSLLRNIRGSHLEQGLAVAFLVFILFFLQWITVSTAQVYGVVELTIAAAASHAPCSQTNVSKIPITNAAASDTRNEGRGARALPRSGRTGNRRSIATTLTTGKGFFVRAARCGRPVMTHTVVNVNGKLLVV
jgi:hypothetical protein